MFDSSTVVLYDINTQKQDFIINTARKAITSLSLSPDGRYLATGEVINLFFIMRK
jgi:WD40 repeat protein